MSDERPSEVLGALPRRRPHRRSDKRPSPAAAAGSANGETAASGNGQTSAPPPETPASTSRAAPRGRPQRLHQPAQPPGVPPTPQGPRPPQPIGRDILGTAAQAAAELAEIGLSLSARALRTAVSRLPRP